MISKLKGKLREVHDTRLQVEIGPFWYEVFVPTMVVDRLPPLGADVTLYTIQYIEGAAMGTISHQRLLGFLEPVEREFFELITSVKDVGIRKALRAFNQPVSAIATAIEREDATTLQRLPGIGPKSARQVIAELMGKVAKFALLREQTFAAAPGSEATAPVVTEPVPQALGEVLGGRVPEHVSDVRQVLTTQLHYKPAEADDLLRKALKADPSLATRNGSEAAERLIQAIFKQSKPQ